MTDKFFLHEGRPCHVGPDGSCDEARAGENTARLLESARRFGRRIRSSPLYRRVFGKSSSSNMNEDSNAPLTDEEVVALEGAGWDGEGATDEDVAASHDPRAVTSKRAEAYFYSASDISEIDPPHQSSEKKPPRPPKRSRDEQAPEKDRASFLPHCFAPMPPSTLSLSL